MGNKKTGGREAGNVRIEQICETRPFENGSGPEWDRGNAHMIRVGDRVFITNAHVHADRLPFNHTTMELWEKKDGGPWRKVFEDDSGFQREPCPMAYLGGGLLAVTVNPTARSYAKDEPSRVVESVPMMHILDVSGEVKKADTIRLQWDAAQHRFLDHSYRSMAADPQTGDLFLTNIDYNGEEEHLFTLLDKDMHCRKTGRLRFPQRSCYHNIAMKDGEVYLFAVQDIVEPNEEWKAYKRKMTGNEWDFDFRTIYLNYCPDIREGDFEPSQVVCHRENTCGWVANLDCCFDRNGDMLLLASQRNIAHAFMQEPFFPDTPLELCLEVFRYSHGRLVERTVVDSTTEDEKHSEYGGYFHTAADGSVYLVWSKKTGCRDVGLGTGMYLSRTADLKAAPVKLSDEFGMPFGCKTRLGAAPCDTIDCYWTRDNRQIMYGTHAL